MKKIYYIMAIFGGFLFWGVMGDFENDDATAESMAVRAAISLILIAVGLSGACLIKRIKKSPRNMTSDKGTDLIR